MLTGSLTACRFNNDNTAQQEVIRAHQHFIAQLAPYAQQLYREYHVLPSITLAQAILESNWGTSTLATKYHNLFGVKGEDPHNTQLLTTQEYVNGQWQTITGRFRVYPSYQAAMLDHALLFVHGTSWNGQQYADVLHANNYHTAAQALLTDGYATDPNYPQKLLKIITKYHLEQYDH